MTFPEGGARTATVKTKSPLDDPKNVSFVFPEDSYCGPAEDNVWREYTAVFYDPGPSKVKRAPPKGD